VLVANGLPRPAPADDDRIGGWQLMYQMLESNAWVITDNCAKLIACMPLPIRDNGRIEDIRKVDGDDPADAARYGLVSRGRIAGVGPAFVPSRAGQAPPFHQPVNTPHFVTGMTLGEQIARRVSLQIRLRAPFITSASKPKRKNNFGQRSCRGDIGELNDRLSPMTITGIVPA